MNITSKDRPILHRSVPVRVTLTDGYWFCGRFAGWDGEDSILVVDRLGVERSIYIGILEEISCRECRVPNDILVEYLNDEGEGFGKGWTVPDWAKARGRWLLRDERRVGR